MDRLHLVVLFLVCLAAIFAGESQATPSPSPYNLLKTSSLIILDAQFTKMNKMIVKVVPTGTVKNQEFFICLAWEYLAGSANLIGINKYYYSSLNGTFLGPTPIPVTITSFRDMSFLDKGDDPCTIGIMEEIGNNWKVGPDTSGFFSNSALERVPIRAALSKPDYSGGALRAFFCNTTACFDDSYNTIAVSSGGALYNSINVANIGQTTFLAAMSFSPSTGLKQAQVNLYSSGTWGSPSQTSSTASEVSVTSWDDNDFMLCFDNGVLAVANTPKVICRARDSQEFDVDVGSANAANGVFSQVNVSPVNNNYAFVTALFTQGSSSTWRGYIVSRGADAALDPRALYFGSSSARVASHSKGSIIAVANVYAAAITVNIFGLDVRVQISQSISDTTNVNQMSVFAPPVAPPVAAPVAPPVVTTVPTAAPIAAVSPVSASPLAVTPVVSATPQVVPVPNNGTENLQGNTTLSDGVQAAIGVSVSAVLAGTGLFVLLFMLKKKRDAKKKLGEETPMDSVEGAHAGSDGTYGNLPGADNGKYSNINLGNGKYGNVSNTTVDDGIAVPTSIQPSEIDKRMHIPYKSLVFVKEIGAGSYGKVYLGEWRGAKVAIKVNNTVTDVDGFLAEAKLTLGITPHPNLVQTFGVSLDGPNPCIVLEYCGGGSLDQLFSGDKGLTNEKRIEYAMKIGYGLLHLHSRSIVHRDLAARNILLTNDGQPKISDFGMSRIVQEEAAKGRTKTNFGPIRWMAPECLKDKSYSLKSDVWSFGIMLYEIVAGQEPHEDEDQLEIALKIRDKGETPKIPDDCDPVLRECMEMCWKYSPTDRPSMEDVCDFLRSKANTDA